jgi:hypothetical protein
LPLLVLVEVVDTVFVVEMVGFLMALEVALAVQPSQDGM